MNFVNVYGCVTVPNPVSEHLHQSMGYKEIGVFHHCGYKLGQWHDVVWFEKQLQVLEVPMEICSVHEGALNVIETILKD